MTSIAIIVAVAENNVIGFENSIPWYCPADLKYFKRTTLGFPVLMGRKTYQSLKIKPLPGRKNIVITQNKDFIAEGCDIAGSVEEGLLLANDSKKVFVIGGAKIYEQLLSQADELYVTYVDASVKGDRYFPDIDLDAWQLAKEEIYQADENNPHQMTFKVFIRR